MSAWVVPGYSEGRELGRGASGRVVSAIHDASGQGVAIKYLAPRLFRDPGFLQGFREEAEVLRSLDVPQVVRLFDYVEGPGEGAAIVMELVDGVSLHQMISRQGSTSAESALVVLKGSLLGLASAHQLGIVHRDYKPENVLVDGAGDSKLTDFGVAVKEGKKAPAAGTPLYMAPEQWNGAPATPATDIYAATAVFFECLTGKTPFSGRLGQLAMQHETAAVPVALVDEPLQALIERGMAKDPRDRPVDAMEFVAQLNWVAGRAYGPDWEERGRSELARRAAALLLLLIGGIAGAAGGSFAATALAGVARRKKAVIAGAAVGVLVAIAAAGTTLALQSNNTNTVTNTAGSNGPGGSGGGSANGSGTPGNTPSGSASTSTSPTPGISATTTTPAGNPTTTTPAGNPTTTPAGNPTTATTTPPTTPPTTTTTTPPPPPAVISVSVTSPGPVSGTCPARLPAMTASGAISSDRATTVTYHWARSDGTSSGSATKSVPAGGSVSASDSVTPASNNWEIGDTLTVTAPSSHSATAKLAVNCSYPALAISNPGDHSVTVGNSISFTVSATGGDGHYTYTWSSPRNNLPKGVGINAATGEISGTPTVAAAYILIVTVTDGHGSTASTGTFYINVNSPLGTVG